MGAHYAISVYGSYALIAAAPDDGFVGSIVRSYGSGKGNVFVLCEEYGTLAQRDAADSNALLYGNQTNGTVTT